MASVMSLPGLLSACGGSSSEASPSTSPGTSPSTSQTPVPSMPAPPPAVAASAPSASAVKLSPPALSFTDTGLNVNDGLTNNGLWTVSNNGVGWEYSLDLGQTWIPGTGNSFVVQGDGTKMIWVRSRDNAGNVSDIVMVSCTLDTMPPTPVSVMPTAAGATRSLRVEGLESGARWEYSLDEQRSWLQGAGQGLSVMGNALSRLWLRQLDAAGNASRAETVFLGQPGEEAWHEASGDPLQPSNLVQGAALTLLIHGSVVRGDADYVQWAVPAGHRMASVRLVDYLSEDLIAFYALQRSAVFDAGVDVNRMLVYGHMGPQDLLRNVTGNLAVGQLGPGPVTLWFQQTGLLPTRYAIEIVLQPAP